MPGEKTDALVLAGRRGGSDSLSRDSGCSHKALVPLAGVPMLLRVLRTLLGTPEIGRVAVSIDDPQVLERSAALAELIASGVVGLHRSLASPSASVSDHFAALEPGRRLFVTTADHPLLTPEIVSYFLREADRADADMAVGVVAEECFQQGFPGHRRTLIRLRDDSFGGANLFVLRGQRARVVTEFWVRAERYRKQPWRLVGMFGVANLLRFATARLDLDDAMQRASQRIGARVAAVRMPFAVCAVDVDDADDLEVAVRILAARGEVAA